MPGLRLVPSPPTDRPHPVWRPDAASSVSAPPHPDAYLGQRPIGLLPSASTFRSSTAAARDDVIHRRGETIRSGSSCASIFIMSSPVPMYVAALGPKAQQLAGELGAVLVFWSAGAGAGHETLANARKGRALACRPLPPIFMVSAIGRWPSRRRSGPTELSSRRAEPRDQGSTTWSPPRSGAGSARVRAAIWRRPGSLAGAAQCDLAIAREPLSISTPRARFVTADLIRASPHTGRRGACGQDGARSAGTHAYHALSAAEPAVPGDRGLRRERHGAALSRRC